MKGAVLMDMIIGLLFVKICRYLFICVYLYIMMADKFILMCIT
jgi:hypothetical protein